MVFISSVDTSAHPSKECTYANIPCLGVVDTNISGHITNMAMPGNDDALDCIVFYNTHLSQYILEKKFYYITS
jgi:ribosomal protein S2